MAKPLYVLLKNNSLDPILWEEQDDIGFKSLKESLINLPVLGHPNYQTPLFIFVHEKEGNASGILTQKHGDQQLDPVAHVCSPYLRAIAATALLVKTTG